LILGTPIKIRQGLPSLVEIGKKYWALDMMTYIHSIIADDIKSSLKRFFSREMIPGS